MSEWNNTKWRSATCFWSGDVVMTLGWQAVKGRTRSGTDYRTMRVNSGETGNDVFVSAFIEDGRITARMMSGTIEGIDLFEFKSDEEGMPIQGTGRFRRHGRWNDIEPMGKV